MYKMSETRMIADWVKAKNRAKNRNPTVCMNCGISFTRLYTSGLPRWQYKNTCSAECTTAYQQQRGRATMSSLWEDRDRMLEVSSKAGRSSASKSVRRSKDEIALFEMCATEFDHVEHNKIIYDGWDADIVIEDHKLAILWNGPWHYKQMPHKNHSLKQVQKRDEIKISRLTSQGYEVIVFEDREHTPQSAFECIKNFTAGK